ncbi:chorismate synthase [candidate division KSB1 bacterium]
MRYLTAGESHGQALSGILEGIPAGIKIDSKFINNELRRRQHGYGRGGRMKIESDKALFLSGIRLGETTGAPVAITIENKDWVNWQKRMHIEPVSEDDMPEKITIPRPGHADLAGMYKYGHSDIRNVIERASARETAARTALGAIAKLFLMEFGITIGSHVIEIHSVKSSASMDYAQLHKDSLKADESLVRCLDPDAEKEMIASIDTAKKNGDTVGGRIEIAAAGVPVGLGSYVHWDRKLDGLIAGSMMSIPAIKAVEIGMGIESGRAFGSKVQDPIVLNKSGSITRMSNNAGGIEGGVSNGQSLVVYITMKPISSLLSPLDSVDLGNKSSVKSRFERSDICAVPAASVVGEAVLALVLMKEFLEKFGGDNIQDIKTSFEQRREL